MPRSSPSLPSLLFSGSVALTAPTLSHSLSSDCQNPVFRSTLQPFGAPTLPLVQGAPQPHPVTAQNGTDYPCSYYEGKESCCTLETLQIINQTYNYGQKLLNETGTSIQKASFAQTATDQVSELMKTICNAATSPFIGKFCDTVANTITEYTSKVTAATTKLWEAEITCAEGLAVYYKGALCFACEADFDQFLQKDANGGITGFKVNKNTCTSIIDACAPVNEAVVELGTTLVDYYNDVVNSVGGGYLPSGAVDVNAILDATPDLCGGTVANPGDCDTFFCDSGIVSGINTPLQTGFGMTATFQRRLSESINIYTSDGYEAYAIGYDDVNTNKLQGWAIALIVVGVVVIVGAVVGVAVTQLRRRRNAAGSVDYSITTAEDKATYVKTQGNYETL